MVQVQDFIEVLLTICSIEGKTPSNGADVAGRLWGVGVFGETKTLTCCRPAPAEKIR